MVVCVARGAAKRRLWYLAFGRQPVIGWVGDLPARGVSRGRAGAAGLLVLVIQAAARSTSG